MNEWYIGKSKLVKLQIFITHTVAVMAVFYITLDWKVKILICLSMLISLFYYLEVFCKTNQFRLRYSKPNNWEIFRNKEFCPIKILGSTVLTTWLIVLHYKCNGTKYFRVIASDAMEKRHFIELIVQLRINAIEKSERA